MKAIYCFALPKAWKKRAGLRGAAPRRFFALIRKYEVEISSHRGDLKVIHDKGRRERRRERDSLRIAVSRHHRIIQGQVLMSSVSYICSCPLFIILWPYLPPQSVVVT
jgi:hypothetical protein